MSKQTRRLYLTFVTLNEREILCQDFFCVLYRNMEIAVITLRKFSLKSDKTLITWLRREVLRLDSPFGRR